MIFRLTIECDNAMFEDDTGAAIATLLRQAANRVEDRLPSQAHPIVLRDANGNTVGAASFD